MKSIILRDWQVRATLAGLKTQHRVIVKPQPQPVDGLPGRFRWPPPASLTKRLGFDYTPDWLEFSEGGNPKMLLAASTLGQPGDELYVKEAFVVGYRLDENELRVGDEHVWYRADNEIHEWLDEDGYMGDVKWRSPVHMTQALSRLTLEIKAVSVERVHEVGRDGRAATHIKAEGLLPESWRHYEKFFHPDDCPALAFRDTWNSLHGPGAWERNDWVFCTEYLVKGV